MFEGVVGELRAVVCRSVAVITGSVECDRAVGCDTETKSSEYTELASETTSLTLEPGATSVGHQLDHQLH